MSPAANSTVTFNLGVNNTLGWSGTPTFVVHHCDGDSCVLTGGNLVASKPAGNCIGCVQIDTAFHVHLVAWSFQLAKNIRPANIGWLSLRLENPKDAFFAGSGVNLSLGSDSADQKVSTFEQGPKACLFGFDPIKSGEGSGLFNIVSTKDTADKSLPTLRWTTYDTDGNPVATDTISFQGQLSIVGASKSIPGPSTFEILSIFPNPSKDIFHVNYLDGQAENVKVEIINALGQIVSTIEEGNQQTGLHSVALNALTLEPGTYYCRLSSGARVCTAPMVVVK